MENTFDVIREAREIFDKEILALEKTKEALNGDLMLGDLACHKIVTGLYFFLSGLGEW